MMDANGVKTLGRWLGDVALHTGRSFRAAYFIVDPDVRLHLAQLPLAGIPWLTPRNGRIKPLPDDGHSPILFLHGLGGHRGDFVGMRTVLSVLGRKRTYSVGLHRAATLADMVNTAQKALRAIIDANRLPKNAKIDLVGHSMGGIVARLALEDSKLRRRVGTVVTLGTPHFGTHAARFAVTSLLRELRPGSDTMRTLAAQLPWENFPHAPRLVCLWSPNDVLLLPVSTACVEGATNVEMPGFTHYSYLIHPRTAHVVFNALNKRDQTPALIPAR